MTWKKEFINKLIDADCENNEAKIDKCFFEKNIELPRFIYKYRSFNENNLINLENNQLYMSYPIDYNDPFDSSVCLSYEQILISNIKNNKPNPLKDYSDSVKAEALKMLNNGVCAEEIFAKYLPVFSTKKSWVKYTNRTRSKIESILTNLNEEYQKKFLICCFSTVVDNVLMWSHYSHKHTGFCVEYDISSLDYDSPFKYFMYPVIYSKKPLMNASNREFSSDIKFLISLLNKSTDWSYENELRFLLNPTIEKNIVYR